MSSLSVEKLFAGYGKEHIIKDISFEIKEGELVCVVGPNGSGKSTLIKALCNAIDYNGQCIVNDKNVRELSIKNLARMCSYMPQRSGVAIDISALDVVLMGFNPYLNIMSYPDKDMVKKATEMLNKVGLTNKINENYMHLSEGQKQLCILARSMVAQTDILLMDEPDSALDFRIKYKMMDYINEWISDGKKSVLMTIHDIGIALNYSDRIMVMDNGVIICEINPKEEPIEKMEEKLTSIYGNVSLVRCMSKSGKSQLMMIREA